MRGNLIKYTALRKEYSDEIFVDTIAEFERTAMPAILQAEFSLYQAFQIMKHIDWDSYRILSRLWSWEQGKIFLKKPFLIMAISQKRLFWNKKNLLQRSKVA